MTAQENAHHDQTVDNASHNHKAIEVELRLSLDELDWQESCIVDHFHGIEIDASN